MAKDDNSVLKKYFRSLGSQIIYRDINSIKPNANNARAHSLKQIKQIEKSIRAFGFINPILIGEDSVIIAGHGRLAAAREIGMNEVPSIELKYLSEAQKRAYVIADNRLAELAAWDEEILAIELQNLLEFDLEFDIAVIGFETPEIDLLIQNLGSENDQDDHLPDVNENTPIASRLGDHWSLGNNFVVCGDCRDSKVLDLLMQDNQAQIVITDPPYNVPIDGHVCGLGKYQHNNFIMASGEMTSEEFINFLRTSLSQLIRVSRDGALHYIFMDWRHIYELQSACNPLYDALINLCVWAKTNGGMGSFYRSQHELVFVYSHGKKPHINNVELGKHGRYRTNVWSYPGVNVFGSERDELLSMHPTIKPVQLIKDAILDATNRGDIVLDGFLGSGSTLIAAERTARVCYGVELNPKYIDITIQRWEKLTNKKAIHTATGYTFDEMIVYRTEEGVDHAQ